MGQQDQEEQQTILFFYEIFVTQKIIFVTDIIIQTDFYETKQRNKHP